MNAPSPNGTVQAAGFLALAKKTATIATNLLFTGIVLLGGALLGRHTLAWWKDTPSSQRVFDSGAVARAEGGPAKTHWLEVENTLLLRHDTLQGNRELVRRRLWQIMRLDAAQSRPEAVGPPTDSERQVLDSLETLTPVQQPPGAGLAIYELDGPFLLAVGVRTAASESGQKSRGARYSAARVVSWGLALSPASDQWRLFTFGAPEQAPNPHPSLPAFQLPPEAVRKLSLRGANGEALLMISGPGTAESWMEHFDVELGRRQWLLAQPWQCLGDAWQGRFEMQAKDSAGARSIDIHLTPDLLTAEKTPAICGMLTFISDSTTKDD